MDFIPLLFSLLQQDLPQQVLLQQRLLQQERSWFPVPDVYKRQVYFRTRQFKEYGKLSHKNLDDLRSGERSLLVTGEDEKEDPLDFVLWKPKKEGEPAWQSPWCDGRPGQMCIRDRFGRRKVLALYGVPDG